MAMSIHEELLADEAAAAADPDLRQRAEAAYRLAAGEGLAWAWAHLGSRTYGANLEHNDRLARLEVFLGLRDRASVGGGALGYLDRATVEADIRRAHQRAADLWGRDEDGDEDEDEDEDA